MKLLTGACRSVGLLITLIGAFLFVRPPSTTAADYILMPQSELMALPMSGSAWTAMLDVANSTWDSRDLQNHDYKSGAQALSAALVYARTGDAALRTKARNALFEAIGTLGPGLPLRDSGLGPYRQIAPYILVADLINLTGGDETNFRAWLQWALTNPLGTHSRWGGGVKVCHDDSANNWGGWAGATRIAGWIYLGNTTELAAAANTTQGFLGDRSKWAQFRQPLSTDAPITWVCNPATFTPVNPVCTKQGVNLSGIPAEDISREGVYFPGPPSDTGTMYTREIVSGMLLQVELLYRNGYPDAYNWSTQAMKRMADVLTRYNAWNVGSVSDHVSWLLNRRYGTSYPQEPAAYGRAFGYTDWLYSQPASWLEPPSVSFYTVTPCRVIDTRISGGPVVAGADRTFTIVEEACGVPVTARAVSLNVTVTQPTAAGNVLLFPAGGAVSTTPTIYYSVGQTLANNTVMGLTDTGELTARCQPSGSTHLILDVNGYFE